jgi:HD-GYP domain-containing protein (c-di-GMP phosphodiesterase class II)
MKSKLKITGNILIYYTAIMLFMVIAVSTMMGFIISRYQENHLLLVHIEFYPELVNILVKKDPAILQAISENNASGRYTEKLSSIIDEIMGIEGVDKTAILNLNGETVSGTPSENDSLIDLNENDQFLIALSGSTSYEYIEHNDKYYLRIFTPVISDNKVIGVIYLSEGNGHLKSIIHNRKSTIWIIISLSGILLYILLFFIFYHSYRNQKIINIQLRQTQDVTIFALGYQAELRDLETGKHIEYKKYMTEDYISDLVRSAPLHDIGKVAIPDNILLKPGNLTDDEFKVIQGHTLHGANILEKAEKRLSFTSFFKIAIQMCKYHHEKWNGTGYPSKLKGEDIPLSARIMALADVYDALSTVRPYKVAFSHEKCVSIITEESGKSFDPEIVGVFLEKEKKFEEISIKMKDE